MSGPSSTDANAVGEEDFIANPPVQKLVENINCLRKGGDYCDVTVVLGKAEYPAHKLVLASFSPYFKGLFAGGFAESNDAFVKIKDIDATSLELILEYAYGGSCKVTSDNVENLIHAANFLQVVPLLEQCCVYLETHLTTGNCLGIHRLAKIYQCHELEAKAKLFALKNFKAVTEEIEFLQLDAETLTDLIANDTLNIEEGEESEVLKAVIKWLMYGEEDRASALPKVLAQVRLAHLSSLLLFDCAESVGAIRHSSACKRLIDNARWHRSLKSRRLELQSSVSRRRRLWPLVEVMLIFIETKKQKNAMICVAENGRGVKEFPQPPSVTESCYVNTSQTDVVAVAYETIYRYSTSLGWETVFALPKSRHWFGLAELDGKIFVIGGMNTDYGVCGNVDFCYSAALGGWQDAAPLLCPVYNPAVVTLRGQIYVLGGLNKLRQSTNIVQRFDPSSNTWTLMDPLPVERGEFKACGLQDHIYVCQFFSNTTSMDETDDDRHVYVCDIRTNKWSSITKLQRSFVSGPVPFNGNLFVLTEALTEKGEKERVLEKLTISSNRWTDVVKFQGYQPTFITGPLVTPRPSPEYDPKGLLNCIPLIK